MCLDLKRRFEVEASPFTEEPSTYTIDQFPEEVPEILPQLEEEVPEILPDSSEPLLAIDHEVPWFTLEDIPSTTYDPPSKVRSSPTLNKLILDKMFEKFDDPHATLPLLKTSCPENIVFPETQDSDDDDDDDDEDLYYVPFEVTSKKLAYDYGQKVFCSSLQKKCLNQNAYFSSTGKRHSRKIIFDCSTPNPNYSDSPCDSPFETGFDDIIDTPVSGVKVLREINNSLDSIFNTPEISTPNRSDISLSDAPTPVLDITSDIKATILTGVVCYVDVYSDGQNKLHAVRKQLLSLGATVEKYFTKKVTHVIFREGRRSTYLKAKREGIPVCGILWIEACELIQGIADPDMYRPKHVEKYDNLMPDELIRKPRNLHLLKPNSRVRKNLMMLCDEIPYDSEALRARKRNKKPRKAFTEIKRPSKELQENISIERICSKKLTFDDCENKENNENVLSGVRNIDTNLNRVHDFDSHSTDDSAEIKLAAALRRKSAPGKLLSKKNAIRADIRTYLNIKKVMGPVEDGISPLRLDFENLTTTDEFNDIKVEAPETKRRKLFDPNVIFISSQTSENSAVSNGESTCSDKENYPPTPMRPRTKATFKSRSLKISIARKLIDQKRRLIIDDEDSSPSSDLLFVDRSHGSVPMKNFKPPNIVFTSIPKEIIPSYIDMVNSLGKFKVSEKVNKRTTHVVCNGPRRTLNLVKGIARGCWLVDLKWLTESNNCGRWLPEEDYDLSSHFPAAVECCKERRGLKTPRVVDIFKGVGVIYISRNSVPPWKDLEEIVRICYGNLSSDPETADIQVGGPNDPLTSAIVVSEKWVFDSVTQNCLLPKDDYIEKQK